MCNDRRMCCCSKPGILTLSAMQGTSTNEVTSPPWAAASCPVTINASAPIASALLACFSDTLEYDERGERQVKI